MEFLKNYQLEGTILNIITYPNPILKKIAEPVLPSEFNQELIDLAKDMLFTMYHAPGVGLAAPQVGVSKRMFVIDIDYHREKIDLPHGKKEYTLSQFNPRVIINPTFIKKTGELVHEEGCLSVPGVYEDVTRADSVIVKYQDLKGQFHEIEATELLSVCLQHENDHLEGIVFIERLGFLKRQLVEKKYLKTHKNK